MALTKIDISARNKIDIANHYLGFFNVGIEEKWMKKERMLFFFDKFHSSNSFWSKRKCNLVTVMVGSLTAWVGVVMIN